MSALSEQEVKLRSRYALANAERLKAIEQSGLLLAEHTLELDQITSLICEVLRVPVALVSIVTDDRQIFPSAQGLPEPWALEGKSPLSHSFCQHVVRTGKAFQVDDAPMTALVSDNLAIRDFGVQAYLGTPILNPDGLVLGSLCAICTQPRKWTRRDLKILEGFSKTITTGLLARRAMRDLDELHKRSLNQEQRLNRIADTAPVMIAELTTDLSYTFVNRAYAELFEKPVDRIVGEHPRNIMGQVLFSLAEPYLKQSLAGNALQYDLKRVRPNEATQILRVSYAPEFNSLGAVNGIVEAVTDVTEQRLLSTLAERLDDRLKAAHQMSPDGFMVFNAVRDESKKIIDFEWEYCNEAGASIAGRPLQDLIGNKMLSVLPGNKDEGLFDAYAKVVNTGQPFRQTSFYDQDGISLWISISAIRLGDGFAVTFSDVTERKLSEAAIEKSAHRLQRILDNVVAFVGIMTPNGILEEVNQPALDIAGLSRDDVVGKPFWDAYWWSFSEDSQSRLKQAILDAKKGKQSRYDALIRISPTEKIWIDFQLSPQMDDQGNLVELIPSGTDITERKNAEVHRQLLVNELNHRVKNSLATIQAMARQTIRSSKDMESFEKTFIARLGAISAAHEILVESDDAKADLRTMIDRQVGPYVDKTKQLAVIGDSVTFAAECAHSVGLVLHELATNAAKYGALSCKNGRVEIFSKDLGDGKVRIVWSEHGGPAVSLPERLGFGSRLIKQSIEFSLGGTTDLNYAVDGVVATLVVPKYFDHG